MKYLSIFAVSYCTSLVLSFTTSIHAFIIPSFRVTLNTWRNAPVSSSEVQVVTDSSDPYTKLLQKLFEMDDSKGMEKLPPSPAKMLESSTVSDLLLPIISKPSDTELTPPVTTTEPIMKLPEVSIESIPPFIDVTARGPEVPSVSRSPDEIMEAAQKAVDAASVSAQKAVDAASKFAQETTSTIKASIIPSLSKVSEATQNWPSMSEITDNDPITSLSSKGLLLRAIQNSAKEAADAAEKATEAAAQIVSPASLAFKTYVSSKASAAAATKASAAALAASSGQAPTLWEYVQSGQVAKDQESTVTYLNSNFESLREQLIVVREQVLESQRVLGAIMQDRSDDLMSFTSSPQAPWYAAIFTVAISFWQRIVGENEARKSYEAEIIESKKKAEEAAEAARTAAEGAKKALELAKKIPFAFSSSETTSTKDLPLLESSKVKLLTVEKQLMEDELSRLRQETTELRRTIDRLTEKLMLQSVEISKVPIMKTIMRRDPEEDSRIIDILKEMDTENMMRKKAEEEAAAAAKKKAEEEVAAAAKKAEEEAAAAAEKKKAAAAAKKKADEEAAAAAAKKKAAAAAKKKADEEAAAAAKKAATAAKQKAEEEAAVVAKKKAEEEVAAAAKKKADEDAATAAKKKAEEEAAVVAKKKSEEEVAVAAKKKVDEETAVVAKKKKAEEEVAALAKKKADEDAAAAAAAAKKKAHEEAAVAAKKAEEGLAAAAAKRKADENAAAAEKKKVDEVVAAAKKRKAEDEASALAKKKADEEVAAAKKKAEDEALSLAKKKAEEAVASAQKIKKKQVIEPKVATKSSRKKEGSLSMNVEQIQLPLNPWASMKESTLMRKTIAELEDYLTARNVSVEGKSKAELVNVIQNLSKVLL